MWSPLPAGPYYVGAACRGVAHGGIDATGARDVGTEQPERDRRPTPCGEGTDYMLLPSPRMFPMSVKFCSSGVPHRRVRLTTQM